VLGLWEISLSTGLTSLYLYKEIVTTPEIVTHFHTGSETRVIVTYQITRAIVNCNMNEYDKDQVDINKTVCVALRLVLTYFTTFFQTGFCFFLLDFPCKVLFYINGQ